MCINGIITFLSKWTPYQSCQCWNCSAIRQRRDIWEQRQEQELQIFILLLKEVLPAAFLTQDRVTSAHIWFYAPLELQRVTEKTPGVLGWSCSVPVFFSAKVLETLLFRCSKWCAVYKELGIFYKLLKTVNILTTFLRTICLWPHLHYRCNTSNNK